MQKAITCMLILIVCLSIAALQAIDYESLSVEELTTLSLNGDVEAQNNLGSSYFYGEDVKQDYEEAHKWWLMAAKQGHPFAQFFLGNMYHHGEGVSQNYEEARKWYISAAEQGLGVAQNFLGDLYYYGEGVKQDYPEAHKWYLLAAEQDRTEAQYYLGYMYLNGLGIKQNYKEAYKWFYLAGYQGFANAQYSLGLMYYKGLGIPKDKKQAHSWIEKAAEQGLEEAKKFLEEERHILKHSLSWGMAIFVILILSISFNTIGRAYVAYKLGDTSSTIRERITLNPLKHISWFGSVIVPFILVVISSIFLQHPFSFGWAKTLKVNMENLKKPRRDMGLIALAGSFMFFLIANIFVLIYHLTNISIIQNIAVSVVIVNLNLCLFNLIPFPSFNGFWILAMLLHIDIRSEKIGKVYSILTLLFVIIIILSFGIDSFRDLLFYPVEYYIRLVGILS